MRASAPAHALCADARAWIDGDAAGSRVRDIIQLRWRDAHYYHRAVAVHDATRVGRCLRRATPARRVRPAARHSLAAHAPWQRGARAVTCPPRDEYDPQPWPWPLNTKGSEAHQGQALVYAVLRAPRATFDPPRRAVGRQVQERQAGDAPTRWRARLGQATASGRRRRGRRVSTSTSSSAPEHLTENGMPALGLITGAAAGLGQTVHSSDCDGRVRARAAGAHGSFSASRPLHRRS